MVRFIKPFVILYCILFVSAVYSRSVPPLASIKVWPAAQDSSIEDSLKELKQFIFFQTPRRLSTASSAVVTGAEIARTPVFSYPLALAGRLTGLNVIQGNGQPLNEGWSLTLRNQDPLILIDGIPRSVTEIGMEEIESVTVLKDAVATAMLGVRGSGGALSVITKKGLTGKQQINVNVQTGLQKPLENLISRPLDSYQYALLYNEALKNDGLAVDNYGFSQAALDGYQTGSDPYSYPNVDWKSLVLKNSSVFARYNVNTNGGNKFVRYFVNLEHVRQDGLLKTSDNNNYSTNANARGYFARSNIDLNLTDNLSAGIYIQGRILNTNEPGKSGTANLFSSLTTTPRSAYPVYNENGTYGGIARFQNNILAQNISSGYSQGNTRTVLSDFYLKRTLDEILPGIWVKARASFFSSLRENLNRDKSFAVFERTGTTSTGATKYLQYSSNGAQANSNGISFQNRSDFEELSLGYSHEFSQQGLDAVLLASRDNLINGSNLPYTIQGLAGHASYNLKRKYLLEVSFAYNGANRYPDDGGFKYGFFPAAGLGWNISEEAFMKRLGWVNHLKLYGSYGKTGHDNGAYYTYQQIFSTSPGGIFGSSAGTVTTAEEAYLANPDITWEKAKKLNVGLQGSLFNSRMSFNAEYYSNDYSDLSIVRGTNNGLLGIDYPNENIGKERYNGWEGELTWQEKKQRFGYFISLNASFQDSKLLYNAEAFQKYDWMKRTGRRVGQQFGYVAEGLFQSEAEIAGHATIEGYRPQPGDIKYKDLNDDGIINQYDQTAIGAQKPTVLIGSTIGFTLGNFDFSALLQGKLNRYINLSGNSYWEFQNNGSGQAFDNHLNRWTPSAAATASYPRLTTGTGPRDGSVNNWLTSSFWARSGNYLRLKTVELGYKLPVHVKGSVRSVRIYASGLNLYTISSKVFGDADPEGYTGAYPIQKIFNLGVNVQL